LIHQYELSNNLRILPHIRLDYSYVNINGYEETGGAAWSIDEDSEDSLILGLGGEAAYKVSDTLTLSANLGAGYDFMTDQSSVTGTLAGVADAVIKGMEPDELIGRAGLGMELHATEQTSITVNYDIEVREDFYDQSAALKALMKF